MSAQVSQRLAWLDALRGMTIVLVVVGHVARGLWASGRIEAPGYVLWDMALYAFHGPMLFVLAGFSFHFSTVSTRYLDGWQSRLRKVLHPYVVWTLISASLTFAMARFVNQPLGTEEYLRTVLGMVIWPHSIFWFLYVLAMCQIAAGLLRERVGLDSTQLFACAVVTLAAGYVVRAAFGQVEALQITMFCFMFFFFCFGNWMSTRLHLLTIPVLLISGAVSLLCWGGILNLGWSIETPFGAVAGFFMTTFFLALFCLSERAVHPIVMRTGVYLGLMSLEIYVMHHMASGIMRIGLAKLGVEILWVHSVAGLVAGVAVPLVMAWLFRLAGLSAVLGLGQRKKCKPRDAPPAAIM